MHGGPLDVPFICFSRGTLLYVDIHKISKNLSDNSIYPNSMVTKSHDTEDLINQSRPT